MDDGLPAAHDPFRIVGKAVDARNTYGLPLAVLAELTHRCPLQCGYCSNPIQLEQASREMTTEQWVSAMTQMADLGVLQIHFSGGEPTVRKDLEALVQHASEVGLYSNLITSGVMMTRDRMFRLADAGLSHVQVSIQGATGQMSDLIGGFKNALPRKHDTATWTLEAGLALTVNAVVHRQNLPELPQIIEKALEWGASRLEVANVQYYGWALKNRQALMPSFAQLEETTQIVEEARARLKGVLEIDYVIPDYYAARPKQCMGGWGRQFFNISPSGHVLPCHAAETITELRFDSLKERSLEWIWHNSDAMNCYRGTDWMPEPCKSCAFKEIDFGGCRCQAYALAKDAGATDPACAKSPLHDSIFRTALGEAAAKEDAFLYRNFANARLDG
ncbi:Pyrroloquinoline quinone biosynthesis protein E [Ketogulonicigenium robustum]|uniref:PqqA peptide cyclase n=1 Tax=Ketogulonicigenium robustum TaxID=92947 RepID=A0A1W6P247_9RHOB|nr:pyrroloquinoline quinone biosynthesis protein PqqE [Ketogulonicigenium robustum]ARO15493.1 Pyrroloquinoline quinone biosynthesis protein E [Ketogulonicigenium robustum]